MSMMLRRSAVLLLLCTGLSSCGDSGQGSDGVGGVSAREAQALNDAAAKIDARGAPPAAAGLPAAQDSEAQSNASAPQ